ncbi:hypothetical protein PD5205_00648 [Xanthomonas fragariae]|uniref:Uncharacterized protein n=1 Tax=Xanthomonas fragariae TaxID=48664 RepID=A0A1Y6HDI2_9XANT|nr:hypothetical protein NBC2815_03368 [Xanthomonas fragariae]SMR00581.1 hypothetical protein PD885_03360 [Xanthomonas fragariae]SMR01968.1 hypothetical protein PD5205_00648 [Xanthomonas fragariae]
MASAHSFKVSVNLVVGWVLSFMICYILIQKAFQVMSMTNLMMRRNLSREEIR